MDDAFIKLQLWRRRTSLIWIAVLIQVIGGLLFQVIGGILQIARVEPSSIFSIWPVLALLGLAIITGLVLYIVGLGRFRTILNAKDGKAIGKVRTGALLPAIGLGCVIFGVVLGLILKNFLAVVSVILLAVSVIGFLILVIIAIVKTIEGFYALKNSSTFPVKARGGASYLFVSTILGVAMVGLAFILGLISGLHAGLHLDLSPAFEVVSYVIGLIGGMFILILTLMGWAWIRNADPNVV
ncbi:MAG: hypothetical protein FWE10_03225 [Rikenellaceae bacterium]|nr:hypothetical protein [Rikenellaceae bacterium]MCL2693171.1 hypothetical protein [Rikenellaceae bacterium]